jgi:hypothetical protein
MKSALKWVWRSETDTISPNPWHQVKPIFVAALFSICLASLTAAQSLARRTSDKAEKSSSTNSARILSVEPMPMGNGAVRSWVKFDRDGKPTAIGVTFNEAAMSGLPPEPPPGLFGTEYTVSLPSEAVVAGFNHIGLDWNPKGHIPDHIYDVPHFDFHFYLISTAERDAIKIDPKDLSKFEKLPAAEFVPQGYILAPHSEYVRMGSHWIEPGSHEFHQHAFDYTMIYGFYDGRMVFIEPMISKSFLESKPNITLPIPLPAKYQKPGYYPTQYSIRYDAAEKEYTVALEGLTQRQ